MRTHSARQTLIVRWALLSDETLATRIRKFSINSGVTSAGLQSPRAGPRDFHARPGFSVRLSRGYFPSRVPSLAVSSNGRELLQCYPLAIGESRVRHLCLPGPRPIQYLEQSRVLYPRPSGLGRTRACICHCRRYLGCVRDDREAPWRAFGRPRSVLQRARWEHMYC
jgi:hypothetical protein